MKTPYTQHDIHLEGHKLAALTFNTESEQTPVVFLHGITSSIHAWTVGAPPILTAHPWYSLSLPGHYPAVFPPHFMAEALTPELIARLLGTAVTQLTGGRRAILVGHSTGGFAALAVAAQYPDLVESVCCISGFVQGQWTGILGLLQKLAHNGRLGQSLFKANFSLLNRSERYYRQAFGAYAFDKQAVYNHPLMESFVTETYPSVQKLSGEAMLAWFQQMPQTDITNWLDRITAPTLVLFGDKDPIVPPAQGEFIAHQLLHSQKVVLPGVGHLPTSERTDAYQEALMGWVKRPFLRLILMI